MKLFYFFLTVSVFTSAPLQAQTNYVANTANSSSPGNNNTLVGPQAGNSGMSGINNSIIGYQAGYSLSSGTFNTALGYRAGYGVTTGGFNTMIGTNAGLNNTTGVENTFIGIRVITVVSVARIPSWDLILDKTYTTVATIHMSGTQLDLAPGLVVIMHLLAMKPVMTT